MSFDEDLEATLATVHAACGAGLEWWIRPSAGEMAVWIAFLPLDGVVHVDDTLSVQRYVEFVGDALDVSTCLPVA